jgi:hypothetical protein
MHRNIVLAVVLALVCVAGVVAAVLVKDFRKKSHKLFVTTITLLQLMALVSLTYAAHVMLKLRGSKRYEGKQATTLIEYMNPAFAGPSVFEVGKVYDLPIITTIEDDGGDIFKQTVRYPMNNSVLNAQIKGLDDDDEDGYDHESNMDMLLAM